MPMGRCRSPPSSISGKGIINLKLIAFNERLEAAFFNKLLLNITDNVTGYEFSDESDRHFAIDLFTAILAVSDPLQIIFVHEDRQQQEELHALSANGALSHFNINPIQPCEYTFPVDNFRSAVVIASIFTDLLWLKRR